MIKIVLLLMALSTSVCAEWIWQDNPKSDSQEIDVPQLKFNTTNDTWSYERSENTLKYNAMEDKWEYAPPNAEMRYNPMEEKWELE